VIPYGRQSIDSGDIGAVVDVLRSAALTQGKKVEEFEEAVAGYCGARFAIAVSNGTAALHVAALACGLKQGDEGMTSPNTFLASANSIAYCGAKPVFADIEPDTFCIDPAQIEKKMTRAAKAVIPVHFAGHPCDMEAIWKSARERGLYVIEDAAHAIGSRWKDRDGAWRTVGSCTHSHMTVLSFHPVKTVTSGEGGMILTNDEALYKACRRLRSHGMTRNPEEFEGTAFSSQELLMPWYYEMTSLGFNYRLTDIQSALGISQMKRIGAFISRRREIWKRYNGELSGLPGVTLPVEKEWADPAWHLYVLRVEQRDRLFRYLRDRGVGCHAMYMPVHLQPWYRRTYGHQRGDFPVAEEYFSKCLVLPLFPAMTDEMSGQVISAVKGFYEDGELRCGNLE